MSEKFIPDVGVLVSRFLITQSVMEIDICFRDIQDDEWHYQNVGRIKGDVSERHLGGAVDTCTENFEELFFRNGVIVRQYCTWETLNLFVRLYPVDKRHQLANWYLEDVSDFPTLHDDQKIRIRSILEKFGVLEPEKVEV